MYDAPTMAIVGIPRAVRSSRRSQAASESLCASTRVLSQAFSIHAPDQTARLPPRHAGPEETDEHAMSVTQHTITPAAITDSHAVLRRATP